MKQYLVVFVFEMLFGASCVFSEPVSTRHEDFTEYDFVAKIQVQSVDEQSEVSYFHTASVDLIGKPLQAQVLEVLHSTEGVNPVNLLVPTKSLVNGICYDNPDWIENRYSPSNLVAIACSVYPGEKKWCVIEWLLDDDAWREYQFQKVNGAVEETRQQNANDLQERTEAIRIYSELVTRLENGEINLEEFERLVAPQEEIIYRPILLTID